MIMMCVFSYTQHIISYACLPCTVRTMVLFVYGLVFLTFIHWSTVIGLTLSSTWKEEKSGKGDVRGGNDAGCFCKKKSHGFEFWAIRIHDGKSHLTNRP